MLRTLVSFIIGAAAGAIIGLALAAVAILAGQISPFDRIWAASVSARIGAFAGGLIGLSARTAHGGAGGRMAQHTCAVAAGAAAGALLAHGPGRGQPTGWPIIGACLGALVVGSAIVVGARWNRPRTHAHEARPNRYCLQFRLRGLLIAVLLVSVVMAVAVSGPLRQRRAIAALEARQARLTRIHRPNWLEFFVGEDAYDLFDRVVAVNMTLSTADDDLAWLDELREVETLQLRGTKITNAGLRHLRPLRKLKKLYLAGAVSDQALEELAFLTELRHLALPSGVGGDAALENFSRLEHLQELFLSRAKIPGGCLSNLKDMRELSYLGLDSCELPFLRGQRQRSINHHLFAQLGRHNAKTAGQRRKNVAIDRRPKRTKE